MSILTFVPVRSMLSIALVCKSMKEMIRMGIVYAADCGLPNAPDFSLKTKQDIIFWNISGA